MGSSNNNAGTSTAIDIGIAEADRLTQRLQIHEKTAWMLRSMLSAPSSRVEAQIG